MPFLLDDKETKSQLCVLTQSGQRLLCSLNMNLCSRPATQDTDLPSQEPSRARHTHRVTLRFLLSGFSVRCGRALLPGAPGHRVGRGRKQEHLLCGQSAARTAGVAAPGSGLLRDARPGGKWSRHLVPGALLLLLGAPSSETLEQAATQGGIWCPLSPHLHLPFYFGLCLGLGTQAWMCFPTDKAWDGG